jgi:alpha,alpha-trehalase
MLGLEYSFEGKLMIENLIKNFVYLIDKYGFIPNGIRIYFLSRSQPPFFSLMIDLLSKLNDNPSQIRFKYLSSIEKEYQYWMSGIEQLNEQNIFYKVNLNKIKK